MQYPYRKTILTAACLLVLALFPYPSEARNKGGGSWQTITDEELRSLPYYCTVLLRKGEGPERNQLRATLGPAFTHLHHYCGALNLMTLAEKAGDPDKKRGYYGAAIDELNYVTGAMGQGYSPILPELNVLSGKASEGLGDKNSALEYYIAAIRMAPKYPLAYTALAEFYLKQHMLTEAQGVAEEGLKRIPNSKSLSKLRGRILESRATPRK